MTRREYLSLDVEGHNRDLSSAKNILVTSSDGRWEGDQMPKDVPRLVNELGREGWEMVSSAAYGGGYEHKTVPARTYNAVFKRPLL